MQKVSNLIKNYPPSQIREFFELSNQYNDIIKLTLGEPNFNTSDNIKKEAIAAINNNYTHYVTNKGIDELRSAVCNKYLQEYNAHFNPNNIMITFGGMEALLFALMSVVNRGDEVLITDPSYPNYIGQIIMLGGKVVKIPVYESENFKINPERMKALIKQKTKAIIINSPNNPLGSILTQSELKEIGKIALENNLTIIADEVYEKIMYDGNKHFSVAQLSELKENMFIINSLSKTNAMTGWRVGYVIGDEKYISHMAKFQEGIASCVPPFIQYAAIEAIRNDQENIDYMQQEYTRRRDILVNGLNNIPGIKCIKSPGSFYAFPNIKEFGKSSYDFAIELLEKAGVASIPGTAFGTMGEGYLRFSFANSDENLIEGINRIRNYIKKNY